MPYISQEDREDLDPMLCRPHELSTGELNYVITSLLDDWLGAGPNYDRINSAIGVLECAKLEMYRRIAAPYEDTKIAQNGDVYQRRKFHE